jgi:hypothetical protein
MSQRLKEDIQRLAATRPDVEALPGASDPAPILARTGLGSSARAAASGGQGIASPLTETAYGDRTWHTAVHTLTSTDGLFTIEFSCLESLTMTDANNSQVVLQFDDAP